MAHILPERAFRCHAYSLESPYGSDSPLLVKRHAVGPGTEVVTGWRMSDPLRPSLPEWDWA
jgi:hypothetical protein